MLISVDRRLTTADFLVFLIVEAVAHNRLDQQMVRRLRHTHADAEVEFPVLPEIHIDGGQEHLLGIANVSHPNAGPYAP